MSSLGWLLATALTLQSLGEIAEREKKRREENRESGLEVSTYSGVGEAIAREEPDESTSPAESVGGPEGQEEGEEDVSPLDAARERGKILEPKLAEISRAADRVDGLYQRYMDHCHGRYAIGATPPGIGIPSQPSPPVHVRSGRDWFVVLESPSGFTTPFQTGGGGSFILVEPPQCQSLRGELVASANEVRRAMQELLEFARREGILPGVVRELREAHRLEWSGWER